MTGFFSSYYFGLIVGLICGVLWGYIIFDKRHGEEKGK